MIIWACNSNATFGEPLVFEQADQLLHHQEYDKAIEYLSEEIKSNPNDEYLFFLRARCYAKVDRVDSAIADYDKLIALSSKINTNAKQHDAIEAKDLAFRYENQANLFLTKRQYDKAAADLSKAIALCPTTRRFYEMRAELYNRLGKSQLATSDQTKAKTLVDDSDSERHYYMRNASGMFIPRPEDAGDRRQPGQRESSDFGDQSAGFQHREGHHRFNKEDLSKRSLDYKNLTYLLSLDNTYAAYRDNSYSEALMFANTALARRSNSVEAKRLRAWISTDIGFYKQAIADCDYVLKSSPHDQQVIDCKKDAEMLLRKYGASTQDFDPLWKYWWLELHQCIVRGQSDEAIRLALTHIKAHPRNITGYDCLAQAHESKQQRKEAAEDLSHTIMLDPTNREEHVGRAMLYRDLGLFQKSADDYSTVIELYKITRFHRPTTFAIDEIYYRRAANFQSLGLIDKAISDYDAILKWDPEQEEALRYRGDCYFRKEMYDKAISDYTKSIENDPMSSGSTYLARAKVYDRLHKPDLAASDRKKASHLGFDERTHRK